MKKVKNVIIPLSMIALLFALTLCGCGKKDSREVYDSEGSKVYWLLREDVENNVSLSVPKQEAKESYMETSAAAIKNIKSYKMETKEGKAVKKSELELRNKEREFYLKYDYGDYTGEKPKIEEELKKYYDDLKNKIDKFDKKYHKEVGEDIYWN